jgi:ABC-type antimicrobial peptide transport system permease subunit
MAGIYSVVSFTVARRTREIAIRVALGASALSVVATIFRRPLMQVASGVAAGCLVMGGLVGLSLGGTQVTFLTVARHASILGLYGIAMIGVCALACAGPAVRALRVQPTETLRDDG